MFSELRYYQPRLCTYAESILVDIKTIAWYHIYRIFKRIQTYRNIEKNHCLLEVEVGKMGEGSLKGLNFQVYDK